MKALGKLSGGKSLRIGIIAIVLVLAAGVVLFDKNRIMTTLKPGDTIKINFAEGSRLRPYFSQVKVSFVPVGVVTGVDRQADGSALVSVKLDDGVREKLGSQPSAVIRPTTLLGGNYFVDLERGGGPGEFSGTIPRERAQLPVELDNVAGALQPSALQGAQHSVENLDNTLQEGGRDALDRLLADAPGALGPAADVLTAAQGENPRTDLANVVTGLETAASQLTEHQGRLDAIVSGLRTTGSVLADRSDDLATAIANLPGAVTSTNSGMQRLDASLGKLRDTADAARPVAQQLAGTLQHLDPVLVKAKPFVGQLEGLLADARPLVQGLVPASQQATAVLSDVRGPVLDRVNGPVRQLITSPYRGTGPYAGQGSDRPVYQELGYMAANIDRASSLMDRNGSAMSFQPGLGPGTADGLPINVQQLFQVLTASIQRQQGAR